MVERESQFVQVVLSLSMAHANLQNKYMFKMFLKFFSSLVRLGSS